MPWTQLGLGILGEFASLQSWYGNGSAVHTRIAVLLARRAEATREWKARNAARHQQQTRAAVAAWNTRNPEERKARQKIYDARKYRKKMGRAA